MQVKFYNLLFNILNKKYISIKYFINFVFINNFSSNCFLTNEFNFCVNTLLIRDQLPKLNGLIKELTGVAPNHTFKRLSNIKDIEKVRKSSIAYLCSKIKEWRKEKNLESNNISSICETV